MNDEVKTENNEKNSQQKSTKDWGKVKSEAEALEQELLRQNQNLKGGGEELKLAQETKLGLEHPEYKELEKNLTLAEQKINDYWNQLLHVQADMENLRRRTERDVANAHRFALEKFAGELLVVADNLERSLEVKSEDHELFKNLRVGVEMTLTMFLATLKKFGITPLNPLGEEFDPNFHEAMSMRKDPDANKPNTVFQVIQKGYMLNDRLLRPALVIVSG